MKTLNSGRGGTGHEIQLLLDSHWELIPSKLRDNKSTTVVRVLPSVDDSGNIEQVFCEQPPEAYEDELELASIFGELAIRIRLFEFFWSGMHYIPDYCLAESAAADSESGDGFAPRMATPFNVMQARLFYKKQDDDQRHASGMKVELDSRQCQLIDKLSLPNEILMFQVFGHMINGERRTNMGGESSLVAPAVFPVTRSAERQFLSSLATLVDPQRPWGIANNQFGDFATPEGGRLLSLRKTGSQKAKGGITYSLQLSTADPRPAESLADFWRPWSQVLKIPTVAEVLNELMLVFDAPLMDYGLRDTEFFDALPDRIKGRGSHLHEPGDVPAVRGASVQAGATPPAPMTTAPSAKAAPAFAAANAAHAKAAAEAASAPPPAAAEAAAEAQGGPPPWDTEATTADPAAAVPPSRQSAEAYRAMLKNMTSAPPPPQS